MSYRALIAVVLVWLAARSGFAELHLNPLAEVHAPSGELRSLASDALPSRGESARGVTGAKTLFGGAKVSGRSQGRVYRHAPRHQLGPEVYSAVDPAEELSPSK